MNRIDRLMGLLTVLQSGKILSAGKLAEKFDISLRTIYRDINTLQEIGLPINTENDQGYSMPAEYTLPPLSFSSEEANALLLLQALASRITDRRAGKSSTAALHKIKTVIATYDHPRVEAWPIATTATSHEQSEHTWLIAIQQGIARKCCLKIGYTDTKGNYTDREIEPVGLIFYTNQWHLVAWCDLRLGYRNFKVPMINTLANTSTPFTKQHNFKLEDYIKLI
ncbi:MAG: YafY family transcriptional regulator [Chitinophaga sp.]|uniref:helix-turn-helix transcriptional regulator n=1 Tax=Chitinophaga sp. TaxID=1869181 RepID=UPI001B0F50DF|nr:YafY family protein [Chitinophaga sp.]MBO9730877.1 YafY family transcriptional regulator [Chitinophaga sp.]